MGGGIKFSKIYRRFKKITPTGTVGIITVFILFVSIMVGYAMVDNTLSINGGSTVSTTTLIRISSLKVKDVISGSDNKATVEGNIKGVLETIFTEPGTVTFEGTVVNMGSSEAILSTINLVNESNNSTPTCITMSIDGLKVGDTLTPSQEQKFTVKVTSTCTESSSKVSEFSLSYIPVNANGGDTTIDEQLSELRSQINAQQTQIASLQTENTTQKETIKNLQESLTTQSQQLTDARYRTNRMRIIGMSGHSKLQVTYICPSNEARGSFLFFGSSNKVEVLTHIVVEHYITNNAYQVMKVNNLGTEKITVDELVYLGDSKCKLTLTVPYQWGNYTMIGSNEIYSVSES